MNMEKLESVSFRIVIVLRAFNSFALGLRLVTPQTQTANSSVWADDKPDDVDGAVSLDHGNARKVVRFVRQKLLAGQDSNPRFAFHLQDFLFLTWWNVTALEIAGIGEVTFEVVSIDFHSVDDTSVPQAECSPLFSRYFQLAIVILC